jgi:hypothetical protein
VAHGSADILPVPKDEGSASFELRSRPKPPAPHPSGQARRPAPPERTSAGHCVLESVRLLSCADSRYAAANTKMTQDIARRPLDCGVLIPFSVDAWVDKSPTPLHCSGREYDAAGRCGVEHHVRISRVPAKRIRRVRQQRGSWRRVIRASIHFVAEKSRQSIPALQTSSFKHPA